MSNARSVQTFWIGRTKDWPMLPPIAEAFESTDDPAREYEGEPLVVLMRLLHESDIAFAVEHLIVTDDHRALVAMAIATDKLVVLFRESDTEDQPRDEDGLLIITVEPTVESYVSAIRWVLSGWTHAMARLEQFQANKDGNLQIEERPDEP
jgi:hypothetical protein